MRRLSQIASVLYGMWILVPPATAQQFYVRADDLIIFYGQADLQNRQYENLVETFVLTRFPQLNNGFIHSPWDSPPDLGSRARPPSVIVMTDPVEPGETVAAGTGGAENFRRITEFFPRARVTLLTLSAAGAGRGARDGASGSSANASVLRVDVEGLLAPTVEKMRRINPAAFPPNAASVSLRQLLIAQAVLEAWHAPALVTAVEIDSLRGTVVRAENTVVRELENARVIAWSQDDLALPMAVDFADPAVALAANASGFAGALDEQTLRIRGMAAEQYRFTIDGVFQGIFHRDQLDAGVNLALMPTPMWKQALEVHAITLRRSEVLSERRELLQAPAERQKSAEWKAAWEALDAADLELVNEQRAKAKPKTHDYELQPLVQ